MIKSFFLAISLIFFLSACHDTKATNNNPIDDIQTVDDSLIHVFPIIDSAEIFEAPYREVWIGKGAVSLVGICFDSP